MVETVAAAVASFLVSAGAAATAATVIGYVAAFALTAAVSVGLSALFLNQNRPRPGKPSDIHQTVNEPTAPRRRHYGAVRSGGARAFYHAQFGDLHQIIVTGHGEIDAIVEHRLNNEPVTLDGSGNVTDPARYTHAGTPRVRVLSRPGTDTQTAITMLGDERYPGEDVTEWTSDHRLKGLNYTYLRYLDAAQSALGNIYEGLRPPEYTAVLRGAKIYDPREGGHDINDPDTWTYSDNAALVIADYLAHPDGYPGITADDIDWDAIAAAADICDESVTNVGAETQKRYTLNGTYAFDNDPADVLIAMTAACDGFIRQSGAGLIQLRVGAWEAPSYTITPDHILSCSESHGPDGTEAVNEVRVIYTDPRFDYTETEAAPQRDEADITAEGQVYNRREELYFINSHNQAARIAKRILRRHRAKRTLTLVTDMEGLRAWGERFVTVDFPELGIIAETYEIEDLRFRPESATLEMTLVNASADDFTFDAATEEGTPPEPPAELSSALSPPKAATPTVITSPAEAAYYQSGFFGSISLFANMEFALQMADPNRDSFTYEAEFRLAAQDGNPAGDWRPMGVNQSTRRAFSGQLPEYGKIYDGRVRIIGPGGSAGDWSDIVSAAVSPNGATVLQNASVAVAVEEGSTSTPPSSPADEERYIVASGASGDWTGEDGKVAAYQDSAWRFYDPEPGWRAFDKNTGRTLVYDGSEWRVETDNAGLQLADGTASAPSLAFYAASNTGLSRDGDAIVFSSGGSEIARLSPSGISFDGGTTWQNDHYVAP